MSPVYRIESISQLHEILQYDKPNHPLISVIDYSKVHVNSGVVEGKITTDFYIISLKTPAPKSLLYGRQYYDFSEGSMFFVGPGQAFSVSDEGDDVKYKGWGLFFHPDLLLTTTLAGRMNEYTFFSYSVFEALHISDEEKNTLETIIANIEKEFTANLDNYSQSLIVSSIELLLNYCQRFYGRQFITRKKSNLDVIAQFELLLEKYFAEEKAATDGLPPVDFFALQLHLSANYLSDLLKKETGKTTKEHLLWSVIERAKVNLLNSDASVNEIAYSLGFQYPQYFSRLFKEKTGLSPSDFRSLN